MAEDIHQLAELEPEDVPTESRFLLEMNLGDLTKLHIKHKHTGSLQSQQRDQKNQENQQWEIERREAKQNT